MTQPGVPPADRVRGRIGDSPFDASYGLEFVAVGEGFAEATLDAVRRHSQPTWFVHGGVVRFGRRDGRLPSGTNWAVSEGGRLGFGLSNTTKFLRPATVPVRLVTQGVALHRGRTTWVWDVTITAGGQGVPSAISRVVIAVRDHA